MENSRSISKSFMSVWIQLFFYCSCRLVQECKKGQTTGWSGTKRITKFKSRCDIIDSHNIDNVGYLVK